MIKVTPAECYRTALERMLAYNLSIQAGAINYRPEDHIAVVEAALSIPLAAELGEQQGGREKFEAWAHSESLSLHKSARDGEYNNARTISAWLAWQAALAARQPGAPTFQAGVSEWMGKCFLPSLYSNMTERGDRLLEEVLELLQANGYDQGRVATLVNYVFSRPVGEPAQEVGGVMVTLAGYCWVAGLDMHAAGDAELQRITQPEVMAKIRRKQEAKNALHFDTPVPGNVAPPAQGIDLGQFRDCVVQARQYYKGHDRGAVENCDRLLALIDQRDAAPGVRNG